MRYDEESKKIRISCQELVTIARRRISPTAPYDEDEPTLDAAPIRELELATEGTHKQKLYYDFYSDGVAFELVCTPDGIRDDEVVLVGGGEFRRSAPTPELKAQTMGEAYISAFALLSVTGGESATLSVTYFDPVSARRIKTQERVRFSKLTAFFNKCTQTVGIFASPEIDRVTRRIPSMRGIKFPYGKMRDGQRELVRSVYRSIATGARLFASAPTGTGKTAATLFPAIRAIGDGRCEKVFYLTPKTTVAGAPAELLELLTQKGVIIRAIALTSKDAICISAHVCREGRRMCPNSACNKLAEAVLALYGKGITVVTRDHVREIAKEYSVCPHELELSYAELCDVVICDFNYVFDPMAYIRRFFEVGGNYAFLVDEAHNLPDRAREMYSAELSLSRLDDGELVASLPDNTQFIPELFGARAALEDLLYPLLKEEIREVADGKKMGATHMSEPPGELYTIFERLTEAIDGEISRLVMLKDEGRDERLRLIRELAREVKKLYSALLRFDSSYELFVFYDDADIRIKVFCLDTGGALSRALSKGSSAVFFSATLVPMEYYRATLGGERTSEMLEVASPFDPSQLSVSVIDKISTRYTQREDTITSVCRAIAATVSPRRGNYMIFSPSFAYSEQLYKIFTAKYPRIRALLQKKDMTLKERGEFLDTFREKNDSYLIGFCVMGGIYSEGVDLVGDSLIGAVVVGIGIPQISYEREAMSSYYDERFEAGKQYAYIYPGMNRVFQAAGRVIRTENDRGVIVLIDDRFADPIYKKSASDLFRDMKFIPDAKTLKETIEAFWKSVDEENKRDMTI